MLQIVMKVSFIGRIKKLLVIQVLIYWFKKKNKKKKKKQKKLENMIKKN